MQKSDLDHNEVRSPSFVHGTNLTPPISQYQHVNKSELDEAQIRALEEHEISQGPLSVLQQSVRATKAVSLIPPAYYADLACERGRMYLNDFLNLGAEKSVSGRGRKDRETMKKEVYDECVKAWGSGIHERDCKKVLRLLAKNVKTDLRNILLMNLSLLTAFLFLPLGVSVHILEIV
ncbi:2802_t:CDS:2, partial [Acaulospora colombiana]